MYVLFCYVTHVVWYVGSVYFCCFVVWSAVSVYFIVIRYSVVWSAVCFCLLFIVIMLFDLYVYLLFIIILLFGCLICCFCFCLLSFRFFVVWSVCLVIVYCYSVKLLFDALFLSTVDCYSAILLLYLLFLLISVILLPPLVSVSSRKTVRDEAGASAWAELSPLIQGREEGKLGKAFVIHRVWNTW